MLSSISLFTSANAGELSVTGTAKATYNVLSGYAQNSNKGLGVANEFNLGASGELENGWTWNYSIAMDPGNTATNALTSNVENDDSSLTLSTPYGTVGIFSMAGALDVEDSASQSVYGRPTDIGDPSATVDNFTIDSYNNIQYHTPAGLIPFGTTVKVAYAPGLDATQNSANAGGATTTQSATSMGSSATEYQITTAPIDGLTIGASYIEFKDAGLPGTKSALDQSPESGAVYAKYKIGNLGLGYSEARVSNLLETTAAATTVEWYEQTNYSVAYVFDSVSISYEKETSKPHTVTPAQTVYEQDSSAIQAAYTMGGMTFAVSLGKFDNNGYVQAADAEQALFAITMAF